MAHVIDPTECTGCGACKDECPVAAVSLDASELFFVISAETCTDCGDCVGVCPTEAVRPPVAAPQT